MMCFFFFFFLRWIGCILTCSCDGWFCARCLSLICLIFFTGAGGRFTEERRATQQTTTRPRRPRRGECYQYSITLCCVFFCQFFLFFVFGFFCCCCVFVCVFFLWSVCLFFVFVRLFLFLRKHTTYIPRTTAVRWRISSKFILASCV